MAWRKRLYSIIEVADEDDKISKLYDWFMMLVIIVSIVPLAFKENSTTFLMLDKITVIIFIVDYVLRLATADIKMKKGALSFFLYPFSGMAILDLLSILPSVTILNSSLKLLKILRLFRTFRVFRVFKAVRYSKSINMVINVFKKQKDSLITVCILATFFDAIYWATVSLTTVGYGDIYATSTAGKIITMLSAIFGIAIVALPAGIVTAGYMSELEENKKTEE